MKKSIYSVTPGRSGTVYLTEFFKKNLKDAQVWHERTGFPHFGKTTPDASHATGFNVIGNSQEISQFWRQKLLRDAASPEEWFVEISHFLAKAGLVENLPYLQGQREVHLILQRRDPFKVVWSYINRYDFYNVGFTWLFTLDFRSPNRIIDPTPFVQYGMYGQAVWYVNEVYARQAFYELFCKEMKGVITHRTQLEDIITKPGAATLLSSLTGKEVPETEVIIPPKQNATKQVHFGTEVEDLAKKIIQQHWRDPDEAGEVFYKSGKRLGTPNIRMSAAS